MESGGIPESLEERAGGLTEIVARPQSCEALCNRHNAGKECPFFLVSSYYIFDQINSPARV